MYTSEFPHADTPPDTVTDAVAAALQIEAAFATISEQDGFGGRKPSNAEHVLTRVDHITDWRADIHGSRAALSVQTPRVERPISIDNAMTRLALRSPGELPDNEAVLRFYRFEATTPSQALIIDPMLSETGEISELLTATGTANRQQLRSQLKGIIARPPRREHLDVTYAIVPTVEEAPLGSLRIITDFDERTLDEGPCTRHSIRLRHGFLQFSAVIMTTENAPPKLRKLEYTSQPEASVPDSSHHSYNLPEHFGSAQLRIVECASRQLLRHAAALYPTRSR